MMYNILYCSGILILLDFESRLSDPCNLYITTIEELPSFKLKPMKRSVVPPNLYPQTRTKMVVPDPPCTCIDPKAS